MNINVTISVSPALLVVLETFASALVRTTPSAPVVNGTAVNGSTKKTADPVKEDKKSEPGEITANEVTLEQVRAAVHKKTQAGKREEVKGLLVQFSADKVTALKKEQYPEFMEKLQAV